MSNNWFFAGELAWRWPTAIACLLLAVLIAGLELRKRQRNAWLRILLSWIAVAALWLVAWQPAFFQALPGQQAALLTPHAPKERLDSLREHYPGLQTYSLLEQEGDAINLPHPAHLQQELASGSKLFVLGDGPPPASLTYLKDFELTHLPGNSKSGLLNLSYSTHLLKGDTLSLHGSWQKAADSLKIRLSLAGKLLDSAMVYPESQSFRLSHVPRLSGPLQYQLWAENTGKDTLEHLLVPVKVQENKPLKIAFFTGYPSFESSYLKNWLARQGHSVYYQAEMAPDRYVREWFNLPDKELAGLNKKLLSKVDLVLVDQSYFSELSLASHQQIETAVRGGVGLLLLANGSPLNWPRQAWKNLFSLRLGSSLQEKKQTPGEPAGESSSLKYIQADGEGWLREESLGLLRQSYGLGSLGINLVTETFPLLLQAKEEFYAQHWTRQFNKVVRASMPEGQLRAAFPAFVGQRQQLVVWQTEKEEPQLVLTEPNGRKEVLPLIQDSRVPERWFAYQWPVTEGFYTLSWPGVDSLRFQVLDSTALPAWRQQEKKRQLQAFIANKEGNFRSRSSAESKQQHINYQQKEVPLYWFYLLFLVSVTGLWIERKLNAQ